MESITIHEKKFILSISEKKIGAAVSQIAENINRDLGSGNVLFAGILNGAFMFAADLLKKIRFDCEVTFIKTSSYDGTKSSGHVEHVIGLNETIKEKTVVLIEDIVDSGNTLEAVIERIEKHQPAEIKIAALLFKSNAYQYTRKIDYTGFHIPERFVVGYGLDYNGFGRNLDSIYTEV
jgi:hypoxanthine phosphoribosyltransferase